MSAEDEKKTRKRDDNPRRRNDIARQSEVKSALSEVLKSEQFANSSQLSDFLKYIVTKTLDEKQDEIKAYTIAVDALGRGEDFDPQTNAAVRVAAGRLRQSLSLYNAQGSQNSSNVKIKLKAGSYIPTFEIQNLTNTAHVQLEELANKPILEDHPQSDKASQKTEPSLIPPPTSNDKNNFTNWIIPLIALAMLALGAAYFIVGLAPSNTPQTAVKKNPAADRKIQLADIDINLRPKISVTLVLPDKPYPRWYNAGEVADSIALTLARFDDYQFLGVVSNSAYPLKNSRNSDYDLHITAYRRGANVRMFARLIREKDGTILWSTQNLFNPPDDLVKRDVPKLAGRYLSSLSSPYGVIYADLLKAGPDREKLSCVVATYQFFNHESDERHLKARNCAEKLVKGGTHLPSVYAALTFLYLDEYRQGRNKKQRDPLRAAEKMALRAVELGPKSARAHQAMFAVRKVRGNKKEAEKFATRALLLNPYDTDIIGDYAAWLISNGDLSKGEELLKQVEGLLDARPAWIEVFKYLVLELRDEKQGADNLADHMDITRSPLMAFCVAISSHRQNNIQQRNAALKEISKVSPELILNTKVSFLKRGFSQDIAEKLAGMIDEINNSIAAASQN